MVGDSDIIQTINQFKGIDQEGLLVKDQSLCLRLSEQSLHSGFPLVVKQGINAAI